MTYRLSMACSRFLEWWFAELASLLPPRWRNRLLAPKAQLRVRLGEKAATLLFSEGREFLPLDNLDISGVTEDRHVVQQLREALARAGVVAGSAVIELANGKFVSLQLKLPVAARDHLNEILRNEMDRYTPFNHKQVYFDHRVGPTDPSGTTFSVDVILTPKQPIDEWIAHLESVGLRVAHVEPTADSLERPLSVNLAPRERILGARRKRIAHGAIGASFAFAVLALGAWLPVGQRLHSLEWVDGQLEQTRAAANELIHVKQQLASVEAAGKRIRQESAERPPVILLWAELTRLIPDDTWLKQLTRRGDRIQVVGFSENASSLIEILESSELLSDVRFDAPVTIDSERSREHFNIAATLASRG